MISLLTLIFSACLVALARSEQDVDIRNDGGDIVLVPGSNGTVRVEGFGDLIGCADVASRYADILKNISVRINVDMTAPSPRLECITSTGGTCTGGYELVSTAQDASQTSYCCRIASSSVVTGSLYGTTHDGAGAATSLEVAELRESIANQTAQIDRLVALVEQQQTTIGALQTLITTLAGQTASLVDESQTQQTSIVNLEAQVNTTLTAKQQLDCLYVFAQSGVDCPVGYVIVGLEWNDNSGSSDPKFHRKTCCRLL